MRIAAAGVCPHFGAVLVAAAFVGIGSAVFHPESSRVARMASGGRHGFAQSMFQVGGNTGSAIGPLIAALVIAPYGQRSIAWFALAALLGIFLLLKVSAWYAANRVSVERDPQLNAKCHRIPVALCWARSRYCWS